MQHVPYSLITEKMRIQAVGRDMSENFLDSIFMSVFKRIPEPLQLATAHPKVRALLHPPWNRQCNGKKIPWEGELNLRFDP